MGGVDTSWRLNVKYPVSAIRAHERLSEPYECAKTCIRMHWLKSLMATSTGP